MYPAGRLYRFHPLLVNMPNIIFQRNSFHTHPIIRMLPLQWKFQTSPPSIHLHPTITACHSVNPIWGGNLLLTPAIKIQRTLNAQDRCSNLVPIKFLSVKQCQYSTYYLFFYPRTEPEIHLPFLRNYWTNNVFRI